MPVIAKFKIQREKGPNRLEDIVDIQVTGNNLQELINQAEKFAQDYAVLNYYAPDKMKVKLF